MNAQVDIDAGVCGFHTSAVAKSEDGQSVCYEITTDCEKIRNLAQALSDVGSIDAYQEISPASESRLLAISRQTLSGCCSGCAVPVGLFKAMQVAAGLALPKDIEIRLSKE
ncbi:MAG TPA: hypothetical protein PKH07_12195 [bacterium]|nr:hypothetical protein [bacterium]